MEVGSPDLDSLDGLDLTSESGSDFEAQPSNSKRRKQALNPPLPPKRPRRAAALRLTLSPGSSPISPPPGPSLQQQPNQGSGSQDSPTPAESLGNGSPGISAKDIYDAVCSGKSAIVTVVEEWLDGYKQSREAGLLVLINFIVQSCGCKGVVTREMFETMQNADIIGNLTKEFNEDSVNYPLSTPGPQMKRFKASLCEFFRVLVRSCRNSLIYDEYLFPSLLALLTGLSDSQVRAFRHTSTLLAMKLMTEMVEVSVTVSVQLQTTQRRADMENSKRPHERSTDRLEDLRAAFSQLQENRQDLSSMVNGILRGVFVHRYRDRVPEIRSVCIEGLGLWVKTNPEDFLNDGCLKYFGWTLHDKQSPVRLQCVRALQGLYQEKEFIGRLELFTSRFKERILAMVLDKDPDVAVEVVNLLMTIDQTTDEGLNEEECHQIFPLIYALHRGLASTAGAFVYNKLKDMTGPGDNGDEWSNNAAFLQILVTFFIESQFHDHGAYLVDSLWAVAGSELRDWGTMTDVLLQDTGLTYDEEGVLLEIMMCAMRQASQATPPTGRAPGKKMLSMKDKKIQEQDRSRITTHFIPILPQLLAKYSADGGKVSLLLKAPLYFDLDMYSSIQRFDKHLDLLLSEICDIMKKHTDGIVLQAGARLVSSLCSERYTFSSRANQAFSQLFDDLTDCFNTYFDDLLQGAADDDEVYMAAIALKRIAVLSSAKDLNDWNLFDSCLKLLKSRTDSLEIHTELIVSALKFAAFHLMWAKVNAVNSQPSKADLKRLMKAVGSFCRLSQICLSMEEAEVRDEAFELLCDLLLLYSVSSVSTDPALQALVHLPADSLRSELAAFVLDNVFAETEEAEWTDEHEVKMKITLLQRRRNQLAGYCKLVMFGVLDLSAATTVFKHYSKFFKDYGDIIKETLSRSKLINPVLSAKTLCLTLQQLFSEMLTEDRSHQDPTEIRELAKKFAMSFGIDLHRVRKPIVALHMDSIRFAFRRSAEGEEGEEQHPYVPFLEILSEFSFKLLQQDRVVLAGFMKSECPAAALSCPAVRLYRASLESRSSAKPREPETGGDALSSIHTPVSKRKKTAAQGSADSIIRWPGLETSSVHSQLHTPRLTSTILKQPAKQPNKQRNKQPNKPPNKQPKKQPASSKQVAREADTGTSLTGLESEDEFSSAPLSRKVKPAKRNRLSTTQTTTPEEMEDLDSELNMLSLIEEDFSEGDKENVSGGDEPEIEDYESDSDTGYTLPSTRHTSATFLDELFDS
ncbi:cohesin subunit SA-2 [Cololabis saira]|uniref:cohesin subunit SA-2 n=1 Tax=Cololabis saira TaxID=129043 RepID=UPI002AD587EC|nr:cohesin subunit SA-2 [Cololabis saira]